VTKDELRRYLDRTEAANGFANRFLWACVRRSKCLPEGGCLDFSDLDGVLQRISDAVQFARRSGELTKDDQARNIWREVYPQLSAGKPGLLGAIVSRAEAQVMRLAYIYALLDKSHVMRAEHLLAGVAVWDYCESAARFIFGESLGDPIADEIHRLLKISPGGVTRTEIRDHFGRNREAKSINSALDLLAQHGVALCRQEQTGGRPVERWFTLGPVTT
jgi:hypothetical protein